MTAPPAWPSTALRYLAPVVLLLLIVQGALGVLTNQEGPSAGFTASTMFAALQGHYGVGYLLGLLALLALVFAAMTRRTALIAVTAVLFLAVLVAGAAGGLIVRTTPNPDSLSNLMAGMFVVALLAGIGLAYHTWKAAREAPPAAPGGASA